MVDNKTPKLMVPDQVLGMDEFIEGKKKSKKNKDGKESYSANQQFSADEEETLKKGHAACMEKMPLYEYQRRAILEIAKRDIERRKKIDEAIKNIKFDEAS